MSSEWTFRVAFAFAAIAAVLSQSVVFALLLVAAAIVSREP